MASGPAVAILFAVAVVVFVMKGTAKASQFIVKETEKSQGPSKWRLYEEDEEEMNDEWEEEIKTARVRRRSR